MSLDSFQFSRLQFDGSDGDKYIFFTVYPNGSGPILGRTVVRNASKRKSFVAEIAMKNGGRFLPCTVRVTGMSQMTRQGIVM